MLRQGALQSWQAWLISSFFLRIKIEWFVGISDEPLFVCVLLLDLVAMGSLQFPCPDGDSEAFERVGVEVNFDLLNIKQ